MMSINWIKPWSAILLVVLCPISLFGQKTPSDSLEKLISNPGIPQGQKIEAMGEFSKALLFDKQNQEALEIAKEALHLSWMENDGKYAALSYIQIGSTYVRMDSLTPAYLAMDSAGWYADRTSDKKTKALVSFRQGWLDYLQNDIDQGYEKMLTALNLLEGLQEYATESSIYHYIAAIYNSWKDTDRQFHYTRLSLDAAEKSQDTDAVSNAWMTMGNAYLNKFRSDQSNKQYLDSAIYYTQGALVRSQEKTVKLRNTQGLVAINLANIYQEFFQNRFQDSVIYYANRAIEIGTRVDYPEIIANGYGILSEIPLAQGNYQEAEKLLLIALSEVENNPRAGATIRFRVYNALATLAEKGNNPKKALAYYKKQQEYYRQIFDKEKLASIQRLEAKYQSEKKSLALAGAEKEASFTKTLNRIYILILVLTGLGLFFFFRNYRLRLKSAQQRQLLLEGEKNAAQLLADYKEEERARLQAEQDLLQERFGKMEKGLLAGNLQVQEKNRILDSLRDSITSQKPGGTLYSQLEKLISQNSKIDRGYEEIRSEIADFQPEFILKLQEKADHSLSRLDQKYCAYILMGLSNKEIASRSNVDPKSVRMAKYRIKQKLKLDKNEDLTEFILNLHSQTGGNAAE